MTPRIAYADVRDLIASLGDIDPYWKLRIVDAYVTELAKPGDNALDRDACQPMCAHERVIAAIERRLAA